jgi:siroheme synthase-like protein
MLTETEKETNTLFPVFLKLESLHTLLVGGGNVGLEKLRAILLNAPEARVTVVAPEIKSELRVFAGKFPNCTLVDRPFQDSDLEKKDLVVCATDNPILHENIVSMARSRRLLVNVADTPGLCDFYLGSIVRKGNLKIAISTNGKSPTLAIRLKETLNDFIPNDIDETLENIHFLRSRMKGDFLKKAKKLKEITAVLVEEENTRKEKRLQRYATYILMAFAFMFIGHLLFSFISLNEYLFETIQWQQVLDANFKWMFLAGFLAQMVDGALGMGYGLTSTSILLGTGINLAAISGSIHTAEMFASGASGYSHYKFGNVNKRLFAVLVIPGILGAIGGAVTLVYLGDKYAGFAKPIVAAYTMILGIKFIINAFRVARPKTKFKRYSLLAGFGGFLDSFGGGGWGPIVTSTLVNKGRTYRFVVGTVSLTEFFVTLTSALTFFILLGISHWQTIFGLILGGLLAAPIAARLSGKLPRKTSYILLGVLVIVWSLKILWSLL